MLVSMVQMLRDAREQGYCVPALGCGNEHQARACIAAAEQASSPLILLVIYEVVPSFETIGRGVLRVAEEASVPVSVILDHGKTFEQVMHAIRLGFPDVMLDCSALPYEENAIRMREVVRVAHAVGVGVEAEFGHVGMGLGTGETADHSVYTDPDEAVRFVSETGVDALAVSIGTAHGAYEGTPELQFGLLAELREKVPVPLVLHGGSGSGEENLRNACRMGVAKLNIAHDLYCGALRALEDADFTGNGAYDLYNVVFHGIEAAAAHAIDICGSAGKV